MPSYLWYMVTLPTSTVCVSVTGYLFLALSIWYSLPSKGIKSTPGDKTERKTLKTKKMERLIIINGELILPTGIETNKIMVCRNGKIEQIVSSEAYIPQADDRIIDANQQYVLSYHKN